MLVVLTGMFACGGGNKDHDSPNTSPKVSILSPSTTRDYQDTETINFSGEAKDDEDGKLPLDSLVWTSDLQGELAAATDSFEKKLQPGEHKISFRAKDSQGSESSQTITVLVTESSTVDNTEVEAEGEVEGEVEGEAEVDIDVEGEVDTKTNNKPSTGIISPNVNVNNTFSYGTTLLFTGSAQDDEDGNNLPDESFVWLSSIDGPIGIGKSLSATLSSGVHVVTLAVTDSDGNSVEKSIKIVIKKEEETPFSDAPVNKKPSIKTPTNAASFSTDAMITFSGLGADTNGNTIADEELHWASNLDGSLGNGSSITRMLNAGEHEITLTATDDLGGSYSTSIRVTVSIPSTVVHINGNVIGVNGLSEVTVNTNGVETKTDSEGNYVLN